MNKLDAQYKFNLKYFSYDPRLDLHTVTPRFFRLGIKRIVEDAIKYYRYNNDNSSAEEMQRFLDDLPSFSKFYKDPLKAKGWYGRLIQALFKGEHNRPELNTEYLIQEADNYRNMPRIIKRRVAQYFVGENIKNKNLDIVGEIIKAALPEWKIIILHGGKKGISQYTAERIVKEELEKLQRTGFFNKPVLILCAKMAQRSFTLAETTEVYLAYDGGSQAGTEQKMSRVLSPDYLSKEDKIGNIFSLSFDPNRDDKIEDSILESALNVSKKSGMEPRGAIKKILESIDIFSSDENGTLHFVNEDEFIIDSMKKGSIHRAVGVIFDAEGMDISDKLQLAHGDISYQDTKDQEVARKGKTHEKPNRDNNDDVDSDDENPPEEKDDSGDVNKLAKKAIVTLCKNFGEIFWATNTTNCKDAIERMIKEDDNKIESWRDGILNNHGISLDLINKLILKQKRLKSEWIELDNHFIITEISKKNESSK